MPEGGGPKDENETNRENDQERPPEIRKLAHLHRREQPKAPDEVDREKNGARRARTRKLWQEIGSRQENGNQAKQGKQRTGDQTDSMQGKMVNHTGVATGGESSSIPAK